MCLAFSSLSQVNLCTTSYQLLQNLLSFSELRKFRYADQTVTQAHPAPPCPHEPVLPPELRNCVSKPCGLGPQLSPREALGCVLIDTVPWQGSDSLFHTLLFFSFSLLSGKNCNLMEKLQED